VAEPTAASSKDCVDTHEYLAPEPTVASNKDCVGTQLQENQ
jgi:hypothetical protein